MKQTTQVTVPASLSPEEMAQQVERFIAKKRDEYATNILYALCHNPIISEVESDTVVDTAVEMADRLLETLYPLPKEE